MVVAYHLGGLLGAWVGIAGSVGTMAQSEMGGISGFLLYFRVFIALTHEWTDFVRLLVAVTINDLQYRSRTAPNLTASHSYYHKIN